MISYDIKTSGNNYYDPCWEAEIMIRELQKIIEEQTKKMLMEDGEGEDDNYSHSFG